MSTSPNPFSFRAAALVAGLSLSSLAAQQGITFSFSGGRASGLNQAGRQSSIVFEIIGREVLVVRPRPGQDVASIVDGMLSEFTRFGYGTTRLDPTEGWVHPDDWRVSLFNDGVLFASDDTALGLGAGIRTAVIPTASTKSNGIAVPSALSGARAASDVDLELLVTVVPSGGGARVTSRVPVHITAGSDKAAIDAAVEQALVSGGMLVNHIGVRSLLRSGQTLASFGIDRTRADEQVVALAMSPSFAASGLFSFETAAAWLPSAGFTEYGRASAGPLAAAPRVRGSGDPRPGSSYRVTCSFDAASSPGLLLLATGRGELPLLGIDVVVGLAGTLVLPGWTDAGGDLSVAIAVPDDVAFGGLRVFHQGLVLTAQQALAATPGLFAAIAR